MKQITTLTTDDAQLAVDACVRAARERRAAVTIAVVDVAGMVLALLRLEGARGFSVELATRKARTAAATGVDTGVLQKMLGGSPLSAELLAVPGGVPCLSAGMAVGAVGVSGAAVEIDQAIAAAGVEAIVMAGQGR